MKRCLPKVISLTKKKITIKYDGKELSYPYKILSHEFWGGRWRRKYLYVDDDIPLKYRIVVLIHEAIEKYCWDKYKLNYNKIGHEIASHAETKWFLKHHSQKALHDYHQKYDEMQRKEWEYFGKKAPKIFKKKHLA